MRIVLLIGLVAAPALGQEYSVFDADLNIGVSKSTTQLYDDQSAPLLSLRLGVRPIQWLSFGVRVDAALGPEGAEVAFVPTLQRAGHKWFAGLADFRIVTTSPHEVYFGAGGGIGHMVSLQCNCQEIYATHGSGKPVVQIFAGLRAAATSPLRFDAEIRALHWGDLETRGGVISPPPPLPPVMKTEAWILLLTVGFGVSL